MTSPQPILAGDYLYPDLVNTPSWTTFTPSWTASVTNPVIANGTLTGAWRYLDTRSVMVWFVIRPGSSTTFGSGGYRVSLPVPALAGGPDPLLQGAALMGSALYRFVGWTNTSTGSSGPLVNIYRDNASGENAVGWTPTTPVTFASGHTFSMSGIYTVA